MDTVSTEVRTKKEEVFHIAIVLVILLLSHSLTLGAVSLAAVTYVNQSVHQSEIEKLAVNFMN